MSTLQAELIKVNLAQKPITITHVKKEPRITLSDVVIDLQKLNSWGEIPPKHPKARYFLSGLSINRISFDKTNNEVTCFHSYDSQLQDLTFSTELFTPKDVYKKLKSYTYHPNVFGNGGNWIVNH